LKKSGLLRVCSIAALVNVNSRNLRQPYALGSKPLPCLAITALKSWTAVFTSKTHAMNVTVGRGEGLDALLEFTGHHYFDTVTDCPTIPA